MNLIVQLKHYHINTGFHNEAILSKGFFQCPRGKMAGCTGRITGETANTHVFFSNTG